MTRSRSVATTTNDLSDYLSHFLAEMEPHVRLEKLRRQLIARGNGVGGQLRDTLVETVLDISIDGRPIALCAWIHSSYRLNFNVAPEKLYHFRSLDELVAILRD